MNKKRKDALVGGIEAGGTKFVCAVGTCPQDLHRTEFSSGDNPEQVLAEVTNWLVEQQRERGTLQAIGIGSFGPVDLHKDSPTYGYITSTPKSGWRNTDIHGAVKKIFADIPVAFDTDVNAAALGEYYWGNGAGLQDFVYVTIGTGIGAGGMVGGRLLHGLVHPEMGHMLLPRIPGDRFAGVCPFHGACWEGLCSGPALSARSGIPAELLPPEHESWAMETHYIASAIANIVCVLSPRRVIIGGSVRKAGRLGSERFFQMIREKVQLALHEYIVSPALKEEVGSFIVPPLLGDDAGICGAMALAQQEL
ncbi:MAG: ROK family protein [Desulfobulbaceae bacterium]|nr:ROK family protein [Desulfobulbaceae bacterium]HIJ89704.1 ROK family protein [Deltaproteobacteria bacterium]